MEIFKNSAGRYEVKGVREALYQKKGNPVPGIAAYSKFWGPIATCFGWGVKCKDEKGNTCYLIKSSALKYLSRCQGTQNKPLQSADILVQLRVLALRSVSKNKENQGEQNEQGPSAPTSTSPQKATLGEQPQKIPSLKPLAPRGQKQPRKEAEVKKDEAPKNVKIVETTQMNKPIDFAKITPENYEKYLDVNQAFDFDSAKEGDFVFTKGMYKEDFSSEWLVHKWKQGETHLSGCIAPEKKSCFSGGSLDIRNGEFIHYPQMNKAPTHFSNLKDFFDYMFQGKFYQGELTRNMKFFTLRTVDGKEVRYNNPYNP